MSTSGTIEKQKLREEREARQRSAAAGEGRVRRLKLLALALGIAAILVSALVLISQSGSDQPAPSQGGGGSAAAASDSLAGIPQNGIVLGDPKAPVTLIEFADLQCPYCGYVATEGALPTVIDRYVRSGQVKVELHLLRFLGPDSARAATVAAAAAQQDKLWQFAQAFYSNQGKEGSGYVTDSFLRAITSRIGGLNAAEMLSQADGAKAKAMADGWTRDGDARRVNATPTFSVRSGDGAAKQIKVQLDDVSSFSRPIDGALAG